MTTFWEIIFWVSLFCLFYTFVGYGLLLLLLINLKKLIFGKKKLPDLVAESELPEVCLIVAAFNEKKYVDMKIANSMALDYPTEKFTIIWVNDGSDDGTPDLVKSYPSVTLLHNPQRSGKIVAMNRGVAFSTAPILLFSDANTILTSNSIKAVVRHFQDNTIGCVAGEKQFFQDMNQPVAAVGEGLYWRIESWMKQLDYKFYSAIGATGELFAVRREMYQPVEPDTLLDDFMISMKIAEQGYRVAYEPAAVASEHGSYSVHEELKRKVRIAAGCFQSFFRLKKLINPFHKFKLFFQYFSHKVFRWIIAPLALPAVLISNLILINSQVSELNSMIYNFILGFQIVLYIFALIGLMTQNHPHRVKFLYAPFYFVAMNYAMYKGFIRFIKGKQNVLWEKAKRSDEKPE